MLYFSKLRIISVLIFTLVISYFAVSNFLKFDDDYFSKNIKLGLDLQGGSYLLLEIDNEPVITQKLQSKLIELKRYFKEKKLTLRNFSIEESSIIFESSNENVNKIKKILDDDESEINPYFQQYKSHQFDFIEDNNFFKLTLSNYGLVLLKNSSLDQAIEIVRRRVDEVGTNEPNILKRGNDRILVELPGLDDPGRIKSLLGKTANLTFRFVTNLNVKFAVLPSSDLILKGSSNPGNSTKILSLPLLRILGSLVPISSILLLTISKAWSCEDVLRLIIPCLE